MRLLSHRAALWLGFAVVASTVALWLWLPKLASVAPTDAGTQNVSLRPNASLAAGSSGSEKTQAGVRGEAPQATTASSASIVFVDSETQAAPVSPVHVIPIALQRAVSSREPIRAATVDRSARLPSLTADTACELNGTDLDKAPSDWYVIRCRGYVEMLLRRAQMKGTVGLERLSRLVYTIRSLPGSDVASLRNVKLFAEAIDPATARILDPAFVWDSGRFERVTNVVRDLQRAAGTLRLRSGAYSVWIEGAEDSPPNWTCDPIDTVVPGVVTLSLSRAKGFIVRIEGAPRATGVVWVSPETSSTIESESLLREHGEAFVRTDDLVDGAYEVSGIGDGWAAATQRIRIRGRRPSEAIVVLVATPVATAKIVVTPRARLRGCVVGDPQANGALRYLSMCIRNGMRAFRDRDALYVVGIPDTPRELLVLDETETGRAARVVVTTGSGEYFVRFAATRAGTVRNGATFAARVVKHHGRRGVSFNLEAQVVLSNRTFWTSVHYLDFMSGKDPLTREAWQVRLDPGIRRYRLVAYVGTGRGTRVLLTEAATW